MTVIRNLDSSSEKSFNSDSDEAKDFVAKDISSLKSKVLKRSNTSSDFPSLAN